MRTQGGFITLDFIFAMVIAFGMSAVVFALTFTLSVIEVTQYVVFSSARSLAAAHVDKATQEKLARAKYASLIADPVLSPLYSNGWFTVSGSQELEVRSGDGNNFSTDYPSAGAANRDSFQGVRLSFQANMLALRLPVLGAITPDDEGFKTRLVAMLIREPTQTECQAFMEERKDQIWQLEGGKWAKFKKSGEIATPQEDNGC